MTLDVASAGIVDALAIIERMGGRDLVVKLVAMFAQTARERVERLNRLLAADDRVQLSRVAHALKGSAAQLGAEHLRDLCASLERDAATLHRDQLTGRVTAIVAAVGATISALESCASESRP